MPRWVRGGGPVPHGGVPHLFLRDIKFVEIFIHIVILLLKNTFNLLSYSSVLNVLLIIGIALATLGKMVIIPLVILVGLWKLVIEIIAVSEEHNLGYAKSFLSTAGIPLIISVICWGLI